MMGSDFELAAAKKFLDRAVEALDEHGYTRRPHLTGYTATDSFVYDDGVFALHRRKTVDLPLPPSTARQEKKPDDLQELLQDYLGGMDQDEIDELARSLSAFAQENAPMQNEQFELRFSPANKHPSVAALAALASGLAHLNLPYLEHLHIYDQRDGLNVYLHVPPGATAEALQVGYDDALDEHLEYVKGKKKHFDAVSKDLSVLPKFTLSDTGVELRTHTFRLTFERDLPQDKLAAIAQQVVDTLYGREDYEDLGGRHDITRAHEIIYRSGDSTLSDQLSKTEILAHPQEGSKREIVLAVPDHFDATVDTLEEMAKQHALQGPRR